MAIYDFSKAEESKRKTSPLPQNNLIEEEEASPQSEVNEALQVKAKGRDRLLSALAARFFFLLLLVGDLLWALYGFILFSLSLIGMVVTGGKARYFKTLGENTWVSLRRSLVCGVSLFIALFSPAFGMMIACTYFLMYDRSGIEEVVPSSLQSQFKEFIPKE
jgi:hypothetical protein